MTNEGDDPRRWADVIHYADENDEAGLCGLTGFVCESWPHVTCPHCLELEPCPPTERSGEEG